MFIVLWIIVGCGAGFLTGKLVKATGCGAVTNTLTGIAGAMIGGFIMRRLGFSAGGSLSAILVAILSAMLLTFVVRMFLGRKNTEA
jgi:uncharacterized membrane protein YeaQ/YmgE (transglycosylase-associated protein family)